MKEKTSKGISFPFQGLKGSALTATKAEMDDFKQRGGKVTSYKPEKDKVIYLRSKETRTGPIDKSKYLPLIDGEKPDKT